MKFISFGDLVEVTYDDGSIELVSKENAVELGYKERQNIEISYKGKMYTVTALSNELQISAGTIRRYYDAGYSTGEEIMDAYTKNKQTEVRVLHNGKIYNSVQFETISGINSSTIAKYFKQGYITGDAIIKHYNDCLKQYLQIPYKNKTYNPNDLSKILSISAGTIKKYYLKGYKTGEEIEAAYKANNNIEKIKITYKGQEYSPTKLAELIQISPGTIKHYYNNGCQTGEEIVAAYAKSAPRRIYIPYKGKMYSINGLSKVTKISYNAILNYYNKGYRTGEEIVAYYNMQYATVESEIITYEGKEYSPYSFAKLSGMSDTTIRKYYRRGLRTGQQILAEHTKYINNKLLIPYKNKLYSVQKLANIIHISTNTIKRYYSQGILTGEEMLIYYNRRKR